MGTMKHNMQIRRRFYRIVMAGFIVLMTHGMCSTVKAEENADGAPSLSAQMQNVSKTFQLRAAEAAVAYTTWQDVGKEVTIPPAGSGTEADPYLIGTPEELAWMAYQANVVHINDANGYNKSATMIADIDLTGRAYGGSASSPLPWYPISTYTYDKLKGQYRNATFNGGGYVIKNMHLSSQTISISSAEYKSKFIGLFGCVGGGGKIKNLTLESGKITLDSDETGSIWMGGLVGMGFDKMTLENVTNRGVDIIAPYKIKKELSIGGIIGDIEIGTAVIIKCSNMAEVSHVGSGMSYGGGIIGRSYASTITLTDCYNSGQVTGDIAGGIQGSGSGSKGLMITNCYNTGLIKGTSSSGQICGNNVDVATVTNSYYNSDIQQNVTVTNGTGRDTVYLKSEAFVTDLNNGRTGANVVWYQDFIRMNHGYPVFVENIQDWSVVGKTASPPQGDGSKGSPYQIGTAEELAWFAYQVNYNNAVYGSSFAELTANIDLMGEAYGGSRYVPLRWTPIGASPSTPFKGNLDGKNASIMHLYIRDTMEETKDQYLGLFGVLENARVENLVTQEPLLDEIWSGSKNASLYLGPIAGKATNSVIQWCAAIGGSTTIGTDGDTGDGMAVGSGVVCAGGLVGDASGSTTIEDCFSMNAAGVYMDCTSGLSSGSGLGGLSGNLTQGTVKNSYYAAVLTLPSSGSITSDMIGTGAAVRYQSYFDSDLAGASGSGSQGGKTTQEMKTAEFAALLNDGRTGENFRWHKNSASMNGGYPSFETFASWEIVGKRVAAANEEPAGSGSPFSPYQIDSAETMAWFLYQINLGKNSLCGRLMTDIDLIGETYGGTAERPLIWTSMKLYRGIFDGNGYQINGLRCIREDQDAGGFIGTLTGGTLKQITFSSGSVKGVKNQGLVGEGQSGFTISHVFNQGVTVESTSDYAGGIIGNAGQGGTVENCYNLAAVSSGNLAGGIAGFLSGPGNFIIRDCYNLGTLSGAQTAGILPQSSGLADADVIIQNCYNIAPSTYPIAMTTITDGILTVINCYYDSGETAVGEQDGVIGKQSDDMKSLEVADLLNGDRTGESRIWFLPGKKTDYDKNQGYPGYRKTEITSGEEWNTYMKENPSGTYYFPENGTLDFSVVTETAAGEFKGSLDGNGCSFTNVGVPLLRVISGAPSIVRNLKITTAANMTVPAGVSQGCVGILANQVLGSAKLSGIQVFGTLTSNAHYSGGIGGLVGNTGGFPGSGTTGAVTIENCLASVDITVNGSGTNGVSGGLVGTARNTTVSLSRSLGTLGGENGIAGGLIGRTESSSVTKSFSSMSVEGTGAISAIGGLIGKEETKGAYIRYCYATGFVNAKAGTNSALTAGGLIGSAGSTLINCYSAARVDVPDGVTAGGLTGKGGTLSKSYYDNLAFGKRVTAANPDSYALTTTAMTGNGLSSKGFVSSIWTFAANNTDSALSSYPHLVELEDSYSHVSVTAATVPDGDLLKDMAHSDEKIRVTGIDTDMITWSLGTAGMVMDAATHTVTYQPGEGGRFPVGRYRLTASVDGAKREIAVDVVRHLEQAQIMPKDGLTPEWVEAQIPNLGGTAYSTVTVTQMESDFETEAYNQDITLTSCDTVAGNYTIYGSTNANEKLGIGLKNQAVRTDAAGGNPSGTGLTAVSLYNAAAYNSPDPRYLKIQAGSIEIHLTIQAVISKQLDAVIPVNPSISLTPGLTDTEYSGEYTIENHSAYPVELQVAGAQPKSGLDYELQLVKKKSEISSLTGKSLADAGVTLSMTNLETETDPTQKFDNPMTGAGSAAIYRVASENALPFRYKMEYNPLYLGTNQASFGYTITYKLGVSEEDYGT